jgi:hypothetical protein
MSRSSLEKLRERLALVAYFRDAFGVDDPNDSDSVRQFYDQLNSLNEGYNAEGRSYVHQFVSAKADTEVLSEEDLLHYDENVRKHTEKLNERRSDPITLKSFQILAALMTEAYLDRVTNDREAFLENLNEFVAEQNDEHKGHIKFPEFDDEDLNKLAFWMATGSGKTLIMHLNYYQYVNYAEEADDLPENILLVTPNEGLSQQHLDELRESGIPCRQFNSDTVDLRDVGENPVKVIEIQKLVEDKSGEGKSVEVEAFGGNNLVFVDEGHKGTGSEAQTWRNRRQKLAEQGFTFEYSATFGQALSGASAAVTDEYGKAILFDYSYPRFYEDGYGKDYRILNLENDVDSELRDRYLLANLLTYYEQIHVFNRKPDKFLNTYNIKFPLLVFIGHTVNATTKSDLGKNDKESLADVEEVLLFLNRVLQNEDDWVPEAIDSVLDRDAGLVGDDEADPFGDAFTALREAGVNGSDIYQDLLANTFHVDTPSELDLVNIKNANGEIGLRARSTNEYFGVINVGGDQVFLDRIEENHDQINVEEEQFTDSLFHSINKRDSSINLLLGSRKFIEGWDSWRVSTMGLMNFGRGEGSQVIQLFGRGVRLLGKNQSLKRSTELEGDHPRDLPLLETLNIFGIRANYMAKFRDYLSEEGIDTDPREVISVETETKDHFQDKGLLVVRPEVDDSYNKQVNLELEVSEEYSPEVDFRGVVGGITSRSGTVVDTGEPEEASPVSIPKEYLTLLNWNEIYREVWQFRVSRDYSNLVADKSTLRAILEEGHYTLYCPDDMLHVSKFEDTDRIQQIVVMILRKYTEQFYSTKQKQWEQGHLTYVSLDEELTRNQGNFVDEYELEVRTSAESFLNELQEAIGSDDLYTNERGVPNRVHFDRHLYLPLLAEENGLDEDDVAYSPPALNEGESILVQQIRDYFESDAGQQLLDGRELFLLRNQSRGKGIGLMSDEQRFFPDFIMWLQGEDHQHIIFLEPHGLALEGEPLENHRVKFYEESDSYEDELAERTDRQDVSLHSYVISQTDYDDLRELSRVDSRDKFHSNGIFFRDDGVEPLLKDVLTTPVSSE